MKKLALKALIGDTVYMHGVECEVTELSIKKDNVRYCLRDKKGSPFSDTSCAWFQGADFNRKGKGERTIGFEVG